MVQPKLNQGHADTNFEGKAHKCIAGEYIRGNSCQGTNPIAKYFKKYKNIGKNHLF